MENVIMEKYKENFFEMILFDVNKIKITEEVRKGCEDNLCGNYGKNYMCPPSVASLDDYRRKIESFSRGIVFSKVYELSGPYDFKGMVEAGTFFRNEIQRMKKDFTGSPKELFFLGAGCCSLCKTCGILEDIPCRFPEDTVVSLEAAGVDVVRLTRDLKMKYNNGPGTVTYFGMVIF